MYIEIALVKLVEILSNEMNKKFVQINAISPGIIKSKMIESVIVRVLEDFNIDYNENDWNEKKKMGQGS